MDFANLTFQPYRLKVTYMHGKPQHYSFSFEEEVRHGGVRGVAAIIKNCARIWPFVTVDAKDQGGRWVVVVEYRVKPEELDEFVESISMQNGGNVVKLT
ncbi:hypothetical protein [Desulfurispora thermophila]|uniref:hypothetical protein n=1 Tax=Desulfurispora thermophila TaxID=265470 RepID=UPI00036CB6E9|nr:hypothetical protein [Desulfurispora thermophila]